MESSQQLESFNKLLYYCVHDLVLSKFHLTLVCYVAQVNIIESSLPCGSTVTTKSTIVVVNLRVLRGKELINVNFIMLEIALVLLCLLCNEFNDLLPQGIVS